MRYTPLILFICLLSCSRTPEQKACAAVSAYMKKTLGDPGSYEAGQFQVEEMITETPEYKKKRDSLTNLMTTDKISVAEFAKQDSILNAAYRPQMISGWTITHSFRGRNAFGALVNSQAEFYVDKDYHVTMKEGQ